LVWESAINKLRFNSSPPPHLHPSIYFLDMVVDELAYVPARTHLGRGSVVDVCVCVGGG
jgi:hypothetical protein